MLLLILNLCVCCRYDVTANLKLVCVCVVDTILLLILKLVCVCCRYDVTANLKLVCVCCRYDVTANLEHFQQVVSYDNDQYIYLYLIF